MTASDDDSFRPRPTDHLVEPVFGGLGLGPDAEAGGGGEEGAERGRGCAALVLLVLLVACA